MYSETKEEEEKKKNNRKEKLSHPLRLQRSDAAPAPVER
jgi:hypothetical protein